MSKAPSMPMYWDAYLADTTHLTTEEHGAYLLLLGAMWRRNGRVPDDDRDIARILGMTVAKWTRTKQRLASLLIVDGGEITQKNLQKIWENTQEKINKNRENGAKGGRPANNKNNDLAKANGSVSQNPNETIPEPEPYPEGSSDNLEIININPADAGMPAKDDRYAFSGETIRLTARDLAAWRQAYPHLSLEAELWALDPWAGEQAATGKKWFHAVSNALAKKERTMMSRIHLASVPRAMDRRLAPDPRI